MAILTDSQFVQEAEDAGFTRSQAELLWARFAQKGHDHTSEQIITDEERGETLDEVIVSLEEEIDELKDEPDEVEVD